MIQKIQLRRGTAAEWHDADPLLSAGEMGIELDTYSIKVGDGSNSWNELPYVSGGGSGGSSSGLLQLTTVDTGESFKIIGLHDGTLRGVPIGAIAPLAPRTLTALARLTSVRLRWIAPTSGAVTRYYIYRGGTRIGEATGLEYLDTTIEVGSTYAYTVRASDQYGQIGPPSNAANAFIDPTLNVNPSDVEIRWWPPTVPTGGIAIVRVNGHDLDTQQLASVLNVDSGSLAPTNDPTTWHLTI